MKVTREKNCYCFTCDKYFYKGKFVLDKKFAQRIWGKPKNPNIETLIEITNKKTEKTETMLYSKFKVTEPYCSIDKMVDYVFLYGRYETDEIIAKVIKCIATTFGSLGWQEHLKEMVMWYVR